LSLRSFGRRTRSAQSLDIVNVGIEYGFGTANRSFGHTCNNFDASGIADKHLFVLSGDIGPLPGVTMKAGIGYNTRDLGFADGGGPRSGRHRRRCHGHPAEQME
jgi:hypothetical protein